MGEVHVHRRCLHTKFIHITLSIVSHYLFSFHYLQILLQLWSLRELSHITVVGFVHKTLYLAMTFNFTLYIYILWCILRWVHTQAHSPFYPWYEARTFTPINLIHLRSFWDYIINFQRANCKRREGRSILQLDCYVWRQRAKSTVRIPMTQKWS